MSAMRLLLLCVFFICLSVLTCQEDVAQPNCYRAYSYYTCLKRDNYICASNGQTYPNMCSFCTNQRLAELPIKVVKYGVC
ncbi:serine protease inhibitor Kazal-type 1-like [Polypterus senegalus]|uniref:serine protease inhibitor Kazal-type 1-like n=1 Tax=Polypterus senegalus TaxID=55291 RepID=UPI0019640027|nr:serine protease inhibitor Kazal-type 1-like [Polypterus senegalus]